MSLRWVRDPRTGQMIQVDNLSGIDASLLDPNGHPYTIDPSTHSVVQNNLTGTASMNAPQITNPYQLQQAVAAQAAFAQSEKLRRDQAQLDAPLPQPYEVDPATGGINPLTEDRMAAIKRAQNMGTPYKNTYNPINTVGQLQDYNVGAKALAEQQQYAGVGAKSAAEKAQYEALQKARDTGNPNAVSAYMNLYDPKQAAEIQKTNQEWINALHTDKRSDTELQLKQGEFGIKQQESNSKLTKEQVELQMAQQKMFNENLASSAANASAIFQLPPQVQEQAYQEYLKHLESIGVSTAHLKKTFKEAQPQLGQVIQMGNAALKGDDRRVAEMNAPQFAQTQNPYMPTDDQLKAGIMRDPNNPYAAIKVAGAGVLGDTAAINKDPRFQGQVGPFQNGGPPQQGNPMPQQQQQQPVNVMPPSQAPPASPPAMTQLVQQGDQSQEQILNNLSSEEKLKLAMYISSRPGSDPSALSSAYVDAQNAQKELMAQQQAAQAPAEAQQAQNMPTLRKATDPAPQHPQEAGFFDSLTGPVAQTTALMNGVSNIPAIASAAGTNFADQVGLPFGGTPQNQRQNPVMMDPSIHEGNGALGNLLKAGLNKGSFGLTNFALNGKPENPQLVQPYVKAKYDALGQRIAAQNAANPNTNITNTLGSALPIAAIPYVGAPLAGAVVNQPGDQAFGALAGAGIQALPGIASKIGNLNSAQIAKAESLMNKGNKLTLGQATGSRVLNAAEQGLENTPNLAGGMQQTFNNQAIAMRNKYTDILSNVPENQIPAPIRRTLLNKIEGRVDPQQVAKSVERVKFSPQFKALPDDVQKQLLDHSADVRTIWPKQETKEVIKMGGNSIPATMWSDTKKLASFVPRAAAAQVLKYGANPAIAIAKNGKKIKPGLQALLQYLISNNGGSN